MEIWCVFCFEDIYDMVISFCFCCLFEYYEDGEFVICVYVCESGYVVGVWIDRFLYNFWR